MEENKPVKTPLVDLLRRIDITSCAEISEPNGWSYHTNSIGRLAHEAADAIEKSAQQSVQLTALRRGLAVSIFINVILLAVILVIIGGN